MRPERIKFLIILNSLRRDAKHYTPDSDAFYTFRYVYSKIVLIELTLQPQQSTFGYLISYVMRHDWIIKIAKWQLCNFINPLVCCIISLLCRESIHELSRLLHCYNESPEGVVPEDGLDLHHWGQQILYIYNTENRVSLRIVSGRTMWIMSFIFRLRLLSIPPHPSSCQIVPQLYNNLSMSDSLDGVHVHKLRGNFCLLWLKNIINIWQSGNTTVDNTIYLSVNLPLFFTRQYEA